MSPSFIARMCDKFREGMVKICVTIGTALIVITVSAILLPLALGVLLIAWAQRASQPDVEPATIVILPAGA
ncbi:MAG TPA: hypothetical protein VGM05_03875 [Planctomycetaceae bacterium]|jgi:hypothetical protein